MDQAAVASRERGAKTSRAPAEPPQAEGAASEAEAKPRSAKPKDRASDSERALPTGAERALPVVEARASVKDGKKDPGVSVEGAADKADAKRPEPKVSVLDLRKSAQSRRDAAKSEVPAEEPGAAKAVEAKSPAGEAGRSRELTLDAASPLAERPKGAGEAMAPAPASADFRAMLAERLQDAWNGEIVQSARIILRDGDSGTIRLRLKPESLGNVKIELNLSDNNISGRIVVESDEAKSAFERNMSELADAFKRGGFETASLQVSVGSGSGSGGRSAGGPSEGPFYSERLRAAVDSGAEPATASNAYRRQGSAVDMLA